MSDVPYLPTFDWHVWSCTHLTIQSVTFLHPAHPLPSRALSAFSSLHDLKSTRSMQNLPAFTHFHFLAYFEVTGYLKMYCDAVMVIAMTW